MDVPLLAVSKAISAVNRHSSQIVSSKHIHWYFPHVRLADGRSKVRHFLSRIVAMTSSAGWPAKRFQKVIRKKKTAEVTSHLLSSGKGSHVPTCTLLAFDRNRPKQKGNDKLQMFLWAAIYRFLSDRTRRWKASSRCWAGVLDLSSLDGRTDGRTCQTDRELRRIMQIRTDGMKRKERDFFRPFSLSSRARPPHRPQT